jgi:uncharacterized protein (DUF1800 family)
MGEPRARARLMPYLHAELQARLRFATTTGAPLRERLVGFWSNHLTVSARRIGVVALVGPYEREAIRPHVLGRFEDLLLAATRHPAMLVYLDNWRSVGPDTAAVGSGRGAQRRTGVNENHARELLELHTLGDRNAYTQADVAELALALTGWGLGGGGGGGGFRFDPDAHADGERVLLGRRYAAGGAEQAQAMLRDLARHPATAQHLAGRLWRHFGGDPAQRAAVARLAAAYQRSDGNLQQLSEALVTSPELWAAEPSTRLLRASEWAVAGWRTLGLVPRSGSVAYGELESLGEPPWMAPSPAGWPESTVQPLGPDALLARIDWARDTAARAAPALDVPALLSPQHLGRWLQPATAAELARAESPAQALALLLVSPQGMQS